MRPIYIVIYVVMETLVLFCIPIHDEYFIYLVNFTKAPSSKKVEEQISFIQCWVIFKSLDAGKEEKKKSQLQKKDSICLSDKLFIQSNSDKR